MGPKTWILVKEQWLDPLMRVAKGFYVTRDCPQISRVKKVLSSDFCTELTEHSKIPFLKIVIKKYWVRWYMFLLYHFSVSLSKRNSLVIRSSGTDKGSWTWHYLERAKRTAKTEYQKSQTASTRGRWNNVGKVAWRQVLKGTLIRNKNWQN